MTIQTGIKYVIMARSFYIMDDRVFTPKLWVTRIGMDMTIASVNQWREDMTCSDN